MDNDKDYTEAFNNGYLLAQHKPELLNKIVTGLDRNNSYCDGLAAGKEEYELEQAKNYFKKFERTESKDKTKDKSKDDKGLNYGR